MKLIARGFGEIHPHRDLIARWMGVDALQIVVGLKLLVRLFRDRNILACPAIDFTRKLSQRTIERNHLPCSDLLDFSLHQQVAHASHGNQRECKKDSERDGEH